jgi:arginine decarboxylase
VIVAVFGMGERAMAQGERLVEALRHVVERLGAGGDGGPPVREFAEPPPWGELVMNAREAFFAPQEVVSVRDAVGRVAAESLAAYPPGVPNVLPGERLTGPTIAYIEDSLAHGGLVRGASDRTLQTIRVVRE